MVALKSESARGSDRNLVCAQSCVMVSVSMETIPKSAETARKAMMRCSAMRDWKIVVHISMTALHMSVVVVKARSLTPGC